MKYTRTAKEITKEVNPNRQYKLTEKAGYIVGSLIGLGLIVWMFIRIFKPKKLTRKH